MTGVSSIKLHRDIGVSQKTAWHMLQRIRKAFNDDDDNGPFGGPFEIDKTYMGGKRAKMSNAERRALTDAGAGRGAVGKVAVVGAKDRSTKQVQAKVVENIDKPTLQGFVVANTSPHAKVYTDEATAYERMPRANEFVREFQNCAREALDSDPALRVLGNGCQQRDGDDFSGTGVATLQHNQNRRTDGLQIHL